MILVALTAMLIASPADDYRAGLAARSDAEQARTHFQRAATAFEEEWNTGRHSPGLARNMAQSWLLAGDLGRAIRDYRRGLRLAPHDEDLQRGLESVRQRVVFPVANERGPNLLAPEARSPLDRLAFSWRQLAWIVVALGAMGWFLVARGWHTSRRGVVLSGLLSILVASTLGGWLAWEDHRLRSLWAEPTVVVTAATDLRTGNSDEFPRRVEVRLPAGTELRKLGERGGWFQVELPDGTPGWVNGMAVVEVDSL